MGWDNVMLSSGWKLPRIGLGTAEFPVNEERVEQAIEMAIEAGYRHFDTAKIYETEAAVGRAVRKAIMEGKVKREEVFITSKLWGCDHHDPVAALRQTLANLGMEYLDLFLVHWPVRFKPWATSPIPKENEDFEALDMEATWVGMERCVELGLCLSIGVSNFSCAKLERLLQSTIVPPAVNQVEMHPLWRQRKLRFFCGERNIHVSAYSPLGGPGSAWGSTAVVENDVVKSIAKKHQATLAQVALRWSIEKHSSVIVKSFNKDRIKENFEAAYVTLDNNDISNLDMLKEDRVLKGEFYVNHTTSPYKTISELWDGEI